MPDPHPYWLPPPATFTLQQGEVHLWRASLDQPETSFQRLQATLSPDEQARAARFHFDKDRSHYIVARGILRTLLGGYLKSDPRSPQFSYNSYGKPALNSATHDRMYASTSRIRVAWPSMPSHWSEKWGSTWNI